MNTAFHAYLQSAPHERFEALAQSFAADVIHPDKPGMARLKMGNHPDYLRVSPDGKSIRISQIRQLLSALSVRPFEGGRRAVVIHAAETMTPQAQNCLLKTLEEPPLDTAFLLLCERPLMLLETIRSRCVNRSETGPTDQGSAMAETLLQSLGSAHSVLDVAARFPKDKTALFSHCTALLDGLDLLIRQAASTGDASLIALGRCVTHVNRAQSMLERNVSPALCAQWLCIRIKEEYYGNRCRR